MASISSQSSCAGLCAKEIHGPILGAPLGSIGGGQAKKPEHSGSLDNSHFSILMGYYMRLIIIPLVMYYESSRR